MISWLFLAVSVWGALFTLAALLRGRGLKLFIVPYFFASWLTSELAAHHIAWQGAATVVFIALGALRQWPGWAGLCLTLVSWAGLVAAHRRALAAGESFERALSDGLGAGYTSAAGSEGTEPLSKSPSAASVVWPFKMKRPEVERIRDIPYGDAGVRNYLDVYRSRARPERCPTLLQIHGGGWVIGRKDQQGLPLMYHLASRGWVCVAPNYRLSPRATFPDHLVDVKRAIAWIRRHAAEYGADPNFIAVTGGSAGGHLAALAALTANDPELQPGFEDVDTSLAACVPFYGVYDFLDRHGVRGKDSMAPFLKRAVMKCSPEEQREKWDKASPIARVHSQAPPFFVIHGAHDSLAYVEDARHFVRHLRRASRNPVVYAEIPGAQHAFDIFHSLRCQYAVHAVTRFLEYVRANETI